MAHNGLLRGTRLHNGAKGGRKGNQNQLIAPEGAGITQYTERAITAQNATICMETTQRSTNTLQLRRLGQSLRAFLDLQIHPLGQFSLCRLGCIIPLDPKFINFHSQILSLSEKFALFEVGDLTLGLYGSECVIMTQNGRDRGILTFFRGELSEAAMSSSSLRF
jgi:hypothetical protein